MHEQTSIVYAYAGRMYSYFISGWRERILLDKDIIKSTFAQELHRVQSTLLTLQRHGNV